jgi:polyribonucleotide nucleotidyltransferase
MLHYNFPPYSVGETRPIRGPGRREIGHGTLALKALEAVLPDYDDFPYTVRIVSDISKSDGSSSMATVCGGSLALMDAGVPIKAPVAGVAMGLISEGDRYEVLTDILGEEDHQGDMDFKVAGTTEGITTFQLDNKLGTLPYRMLEKALERAKEARLHVLSEMAKALEKPREHLSPHAPRVELIRIRKERIRDLIGPGGRIIQEIQSSTSSKIDVNDDGEVRIFSPDEINLREAVKKVNDQVLEPIQGRFYRGVVTGVKDFGVFVRVSGVAEGLVHVSEMSPKRITHPSELVKEGDEVFLQVVGADKQGRLQFSMKEAEGIGLSEVEN